MRRTIAGTVGERELRAGQDEERKMITTNGALFEYMQAHPEMILQRCAGLKIDSAWWWLRDKSGKGQNTIRVHARAAQTLRDKKLLKLISQDEQRRNYVLSERAKEPR